MFQWLKNLLFGKAEAVSASPPAALPPELDPPVIGISGSASDSASVQAMVAMVRASGGVPLFLGNHAERDPAADIRKIDALMLMGNNYDIPAAYYGAQQDPHTKVNPDFSRMDYEFDILKSALEQGMPVLGICGGHQLINVALGGTLHQHVPDLLGGDRSHAQNEAGIPSFCPVQPVKIDPGTRLAFIAEGTESIYTPDHGVIAEVNSMHHQAVDRPGKGLKVAARSADGIIEAVEGEGVLGVQFHPEFGASPLGPRIVRAAVEAGRCFAVGRTHPMHEAVEESLKSGLPVMREKAARGVGIAA